MNKKKTVQCTLNISLYFSKVTSGRYYRNFTADELLTG